MDKIKCVISYDGSNFSGFQIQPRNRTIHGELEKALMKIHKGEHIRVYASGRTDTGVHAKGQTIHFKPKLQLPVLNWKRALNTLLPDDIFVHKAEAVPSSFHSRYDAVETEYRYFVAMTRERDVFTRNYVYQIPYDLNVEAMKKGCNYLQGTHDFTSFSSAKATIKGSKVRTLSTVTCNQNDNELEFVFKGNGFLYHMVRIMVGALIDIGRGKIDPNEIPLLLEKRDRTLLGYTVPPEGLYLWEVLY